MTFGEKLTYLRSGRGVSQEQLAEKLRVSRQCVSKWELDQAQPKIDNLLEIADFFGMSLDVLLREDCEVSGGVKENEHGKYFGTDGFRGRANDTLTSHRAYKVGRFLGWYYSSPLGGCRKQGYRPKIVIGKDTRRSSYMFEYAIAAGITASGADAYMLHVTTTPSVSYVTRQDGFDCGIMITASHNPYYDNGIKVINRYGEKLDDLSTAYIEAYLDGNLAALGVAGDDLPLARDERVGCINDFVSGRNRYIGYLISLASHSYKHLKIGIDCANGASWNIAGAVFSALGAEVYVVGNEPDGININDGVGSTHPERLCALVKERHLDLGFAFDGDADRCIAVDEHGKIVDGDDILFLLARRLKSRGMLAENTVVATVMSNSGFVKSLENEGIRCVQTTVGDRFVYERMQSEGYSLGGEQSGHIIIKKYATTGDGLLTAIMIAEELCDSKSTLAALVDPVEKYPQYTENVRVRDKDAVMKDSGVLSALDAVKNEIGNDGRALLRKSGTEPIVRVMVECKGEEKCREYAKRIAEMIRLGGYAIE